MQQKAGPGFATLLAIHHLMNQHDEDGDDLMGERSRGKSEC